jgi:uncharacterized protein YgbK (DUF1537 family)
MSAPSVTVSPDARTLIIADDLTGACDAAVAFAIKGIDTHVLLDPGEIETASAQVVAICTESRDIDADHARQKLHLIAQQQTASRPDNTFNQTFKKIDSVLRGNTVHEIEAAIHAFQHDLAIIAPAYPALGRTSRDGVLRISHIAGDESIDIREKLYSTGLQPTWIAHGQSMEQLTQQMRQALGSTSRTVYCDAVLQSDLEAVVQAANSLKARILWIGSAGLAHALAAETPSHPSEPTTPAKGTTLLFVGSDHPATLKQLAFLREQVKLQELPSLLETLDMTRPILVPLERDRITEEEVRRAIRGIQPGDVACLFMTGGDTAMLVCRALSIRSLHLRAEFEPGVSQAIAVGGPYAGCTVILKSGGFGEIGLLHRIVKHFG